MKPKTVRQTNNPDFLKLNRETRVRIFENGGKLYLDHAFDSGAPEVGYSQNTFRDFVKAYYPLDLVRFAESYGNLFDLDGTEPLELSEPYNYLPSIDDMRAVFAPLGYPSKRKRKVTQDIKKLIEVSAERHHEQLAWQLANRRECLGDYVAARAVLQWALNILYGDKDTSRNDPAPSFTVDLSQAPRYRAYLRKYGTHEISSFGEFGVYVDGDSLIVNRPKKTCSELVSELITIHIGHGISYECHGLQLVERCKNLLQIIWLQFVQQTDMNTGEGGRLVLCRCENPSCRNVTVKFSNDTKLSCCDSCRQALKDARR